MKTFLAVCLFAAFLGCNAAITRFVCEHKTMSIDCGDHKINILCASYGRSVPYNQRCWHSSSIQDTSCIAQSSISKVNQLCDGKKSCNVQASNGVFGDPCYGTFKYLEVSYECEYYGLKYLKFRIMAGRLGTGNSHRSFHISFFIYVGLTLFSLCLLTLFPFLFLSY
ncbi:L-rhamnose-binding lectin ELEL-1-like [Anneissia japonica]|uniref:L-rhamnose-binding lectin ELEL-1-like n=1 Tax=Anneissia japonica TaxID=1529436 RepID=UPI00142599E9|nr:L-rhamnose-binding lectin ELEL-1-like [Anneissia japonica]